VMVKGDSHNLFFVPIEERKKLNSQAIVLGWHITREGEGSLNIKSLL